MVLRVEALFEEVDSTGYPDMHLVSPSGETHYYSYLDNPEVVEIENAEYGVWEIWIYNESEISTKYTLTANYPIN